MPFVVLLHPDGTTTPHAVGDSLSIGARKDNDVVVALKGISRKHAQIVRKGGDYLVQDQNSTNFVFVNKEQVRERVLVDGDTISLGGYAALLWLDRLDDIKVQQWAEHQSKPSDRRADSLDQTTRIYHKDLPKTVRELEALIEVGAQLARIADTDQVLDKILEKVLNLMQADRGFIMLLDENRQLVPAYSKNMERDLLDGETLTYSGSFARKVIEQEKTLVSTNVAEDPRYQSESIISQRILSIMCSPLRCADKLLGCLYIDARESVRYYTEEDSSFFSALANQAAIAIDNARLTADLRTNQEFLEKTNVQLQKSLQSIIETNRKLDRKLGELSALYEASRHLNMAPDIESVLRAILEQSRSAVKCERVSLMMYERKLNGYLTRLVTGSDPLLRDPVVLAPGEGVAGAAVAARKGIIANQGASDPRFRSTRPRDEAISNLMSVPLVSGDKVFGIINLVNSETEEGFREDDLEIVSSLANLAAASIEKFNLLKSKLQQEKLNREIEDAQKVQELLLPRTMPESQFFEFAATYTLANRVGGDYYDFIPLPDGRMMVVIADVAGHDIASALVMAMGRSLVQILSTITSAPSEILARTSRFLRRDTQAARYITMFLAILDPRSMSLVFSNAGHNYPLFLPQGSEQFENLETGGFPLGLVDDFNYMEETRQLHPGDLLVLYTDGVIEAQSPTGDMYDLERLQKSVLSERTQPLESITQGVYRRLTDFVGSNQLQDDMTFVTVRVKPDLQAVAPRPGLNRSAVTGNGMGR